MRNFFSKNIAEISVSPTLRIYGFFLSITHVLTFILWHTASFKLYSDETHYPLCWPFFENCANYRLPIHTIQFVLWIYLAIGLILSLLFLFPRFIKAAYWLSIAVWILKWVMLAQDYRLMGNFHYMPFIIAFAYLFLPRKLDLIRLLMVGFYISAACLKFNAEWITGSALFGHPLLKGRILELSCIYVIFLESFFSLGLLARNKTVFLAALVQIIIFHIFSWHLVGFFYPTVMFSLLMIFVLCQILEGEISLLERFFSFTLPKSTYAFMGIYTLFQIAPAFYPGDTALTGEGRIFSLNMFDSKSDCHGLILTRFKKMSRDDSFLKLRTGVRIQCDPIVYADIARAICKRYSTHADFEGVDVELYSKRTTDMDYQHLVSVRDFCHSDIHYDLFRHNSWINGSTGL